MTTIGFPAPTPYRAQDGRKWGKDWFIRFGRALERTTHKAGEELVFTCATADGTLYYELSSL